MTRGSDDHWEHFKVKLQNIYANLNLHIYCRFRDFTTNRMRLKFMKKQPKEHGNSI